MAKQIVTQVMEMTCEACGATKTWDLVGADQNLAMLQEMQEWYVVGHKVVSLDGQLIQLTGDACALACVPAVAIKLALPPEPADNIDLSALRVNRGSLAN